VFWWGNQNKPLGEPRLDKKIILKWIFKKQDEMMWTGLNMLMIGTGGGLF
jgi:hypothetical protein